MNFIYLRRVVFVFLASLCLPLQAQISFTDVALEANFQDRLSHGRGLVGADFNNDGWTDFFLGNPTKPPFGNDDNFILWNDGLNQDGEITFTKGQVLLQGAIAFTGSAGDYDNDGDADLFIGVGGQEGIGLDYLFRNDAGVFVDVSDEAGIRGPRAPDGTPVPVATISGTWIDYDKDGNLDLFTAARIHREPLVLPGGLAWRDSLFRNNGDGTFTDVTNASGIRGINSSKTAALGDFDNDGWVDIFIPHVSKVPYSSAGIQLYQNNQDGTFIEVPFDEADHEMEGRDFWASCTMDFDNDGLLDILSVARGELRQFNPHSLLMNQGNWNFTNVGVSSGLAPEGEVVPAVMGFQLGDLDNDGYADVLLANGGPTAGERDKLFLSAYQAETGVQFVDASHLIDYPAPPDPNCVPPAEQPAALHTYVHHSDMAPGNSDDPRSVSTAVVPTGSENACNPSYPYRGHAIVLYDYDLDGDVDLFMSKGGTVILAPPLTSSEPNRLFRNDGGNAKNWLFVELFGEVSNRDGIGARIKVEVSSGGASPRSIIREVRAGSCFSSSGPRQIHFGLGDADQVDRISVLWPSGVETVITDQAINQKIDLQEEFSSASQFNGPTAPLWTPLSGRWGIDNGQYVQTGPGAATAVAFSSEPLTDFAVVGKLTYLGGQKYMGLLARVSPDGESYYAAVLNDSEARLYKRVNGILTALGDPVPIEPMVPGKAYIVRLRLEGAALQMHVDHEESPILFDSSVESGSVGVSTIGTVAAFDNIVVY